MGYIPHHAIIVTAEARTIGLFHAQAVATFADTCAKVTEPGGGHECHVVVLGRADGSKEGWEDSDKGGARGVHRLP